MQPYILIPLGAFLLCTSVAGAMLARGARLRANQTIAGMMGSSALWALFDLMVVYSDDPRDAVMWLRAISFPALSLGPLCLLIVAELRPQLRERVMPLVKPSFIAGFVMGCVTVSTPWSVAVAKPLPSGGWGFELGPLAPLLLAQQALFPLLGVWTLIRSRTEARPTLPALEYKRPPLLTFGIAFLLPLVLICSTDMVLPQYGIQVPRLGALNIAFIGVFIWLHSFRDEAGVITDSSFAREVLDGLPDGMALLERDGVVRTVNQSLARLVGAAPFELVGRSIDAMLEITPPELDRELQERESTLRTDDGETIPVSIASAQIRDRQMGVIGLVLVVRDMRRLDGLRRQLVASGRLAATGELAAGIAHEVNNPVAYIQANLNLIQQYCADTHAEFAAGSLRSETSAARPAHCLPPDPSLGTRRIADSLEGVEQIAAVVRDVQGFARAQAAEYSTCDVNELLASALRLAALQADFPENVECDYGDVPPIYAAGQDLKQVFLSLIRRASNASEKSGSMRISTRQMDERIEIKIEDEGEEWVAGDWGDLFRASFDTVSHGPDFLELGISQHLVQRQGGELWLQRSKPAGSEVYVSLPMAGAPVAFDEVTGGSRG